MNINNKKCEIYKMQVKFIMDIKMSVISIVTFIL